MAESANVSLGTGLNETFTSYRAVYRWLDSERSAWNWLTPETDRHNAYGHVRNEFDRLTEEIRELERQGQSVANIKPSIEQAYRESGAALLPSTSEIGIAVREAKDSYGPRAGVFAYAVLKRWANFSNAEDRADFAAVLMVMMPEWRKPADLAQRLTQERANYRNSFRTAEAEIDRVLSANDAAMRARASKAIRIGVTQLQKKRRQWKGHLSEIGSQFADAKSSIKAVEDSYRVMMGLRAPVEYWKRKALEHGDVEETAGWRLVKFFPIALVVALFAFGSAAWLLIDAEKVSQTVYFVVAAGLAMLSGLIFWIGRLLNRLYLSAHHLRIDAEERAVMTEAYLALTSEQAATEADKQIILAALFRPTADGLVKDDGPDLTPAAMIARLGMKP